MLDIANQFIPLSSSNTQSGMAGGEEGNGRPKTDKPTESTVANQEMEQTQKSSNV